MTATIAFSVNLEYVYVSQISGYMETLVKLFDGISTVESSVVISHGGSHSR